MRHPFLLPGRGPAGHSQSKSDIFGGRFVGKQGVILKNHPKTPAIDRHVRQILAVEPNLTLLGRFQPLRDHLQSELARKVDQRLDYDPVALALDDLRNESAVDLEHVERQRSQIGEACIARPEIVDGDADARVTQCSQPRGNTPLTITDLPPGEYQIVMAMPGYRPFTTTVRVVAGERVRAAASLTALEQQ